MGMAKLERSHRNFWSALKILSLILICSGKLSLAQNSNRKTYCNPMNLDYGYTPLKIFTKLGKHRTTADPSVVRFKGSNYIFSTNQQGYWWSDDLAQWKFVTRSFAVTFNPEIKNDICCPAVFADEKAIYVMEPSDSGYKPVWMSEDPKSNKWKKAVEAFPMFNGDPSFFKDEDGRLYFYSGTGNTEPIKGIEIDSRTFVAKGKSKDLVKLEPSRYGWHRFGENFDDIILQPFIEGAWMTKWKGKYYLQYAAPATEFSTYSDGVAIGDHPLGPFTPQLHNPFSSKFGGFARGAGHGSTFQDHWNNWWHMSSMVVAVKNNYERRLGLWPAGFDNEGILFANTAFGDYPTYLPSGPIDYKQKLFTGWMLLNYNKPVQVSSTLGSAYSPNFAVDENIKTYWSAKTGQAREWIQTDLGEKSSIYAIQINYADQDAEFEGKPSGLFHQYVLYGSHDGKKWKVLVDKSRNDTDVPHDYIELAKPVEFRFLKLENIHIPTGKFAISGFRVFGKGHGSLPEAVKHFQPLRTKVDRKSAWLKWQAVDNAYAYNIYYGVSPDKLYTSIMVYGGNEYFVKSLDQTIPYYFTIEAINEQGVSPMSPVMKAD